MSISFWPQGWANDGQHCLPTHHRDGPELSCCSLRANSQLQYTPISSQDMTILDMGLCLIGLRLVPAGFTLAVNDEALLLVSLAAVTVELRR